MIDTREDLEIIEALDFDHEPPCEHSEHGVDPWHEGPAKVIALAAGCECEDARWVYLCAGFWNWVCDDMGGVYCPCGTAWPTARDAYLSVRTVK